LAGSPPILTLSPASGEDRQLCVFSFSWPVSLKYTPASGEDTDQEVILRPFLTAIGTDSLGVGQREDWQTISGSFSM
jgi:hypothetical protein